MMNGISIIASGTIIVLAAISIGISMSIVISISISISISIDISIGNGIGISISISIAIGIGICICIRFDNLPVLFEHPVNYSHASDAGKLEESAFFNPTTPYMATALYDASRRRF